MTDANGWPILTDAEKAKRRRWLARDGVLWGQINWIACKLLPPVGPPHRLTRRDIATPKADPLEPAP